MDKLRVHPFVFCCLALCLSIGARAQNVCLSINPIDVSTAYITGSLHPKTQFATMLQCRQYVQQLPGLLQAQGYLSASIDSSKEQKDTLQIMLFVGKKYAWNTISVKEKDKVLLAQLGIRNDWYNHMPCSIIR